MNRPGFTVIEIIIAISILFAVVAAIGISFSALLTESTLGQLTEGSVSFVREARERTITGSGGYPHSVRVESDRLIRFRTASYDPFEPSNEPYLLSPGFSFSDIALSENPYIRFERLSGTAESHGTFILQSDSGSASTTIHIYESGLISHD